MSVSLKFIFDFSRHEIKALSLGADPLFNDFITISTAAQYEDSVHTFGRSEAIIFYLLFLSIF